VTSQHPPPGRHPPAGQDPSVGQDPSAGQPGDDPEERDPGLARERTSLAWLRTAISFAALGGTMLKANILTGAIVIAMAPVVWQLGRVSRSRSGPAELPQVGAARLFTMTIAIVVVSLLALGIAIFGPAAPGALRRP
jgi:uncharacterized membrane protein YidH (DUF202 family)